MSDLPAVAAYWARYRLASGGRESRLRVEAEEFAWAWDRVEEAAHTGTANVLELLDALLQHPAADPCYLGAGPVEESPRSPWPPLRRRHRRTVSPVGAVAGGRRVRVAGRRRGATTQRSPAIPAARAARRLRSVEPGLAARGRVAARCQDNIPPVGPNGLGVEGPRSSPAALRLARSRGR